MPTVLETALQALSPSGPCSFEYLVAELLSQLTRSVFRPRRSGDQRGRDDESDPSLPWTVLIECKRYQGTTSLNERLLVSEVVIATRDDPQLDLWVLAASRGVDANVKGWLQKESRERGIDWAVLECGELDSPATLDVLCALAPELLKKYCAAQSADGGAELSGFLQRVTSAPGFSEGIDHLRKTFDGGTVGLSTFRDSLNVNLSKAFKTEQESWQRFQRKLNVDDPAAGNNVVRASVNASLDAFAISSGASGLCVVVGEEGDGKSWSVASWIRDRLASTEAPVVFWFSAGQVTTDQFMRQLANYADQYLRRGREVNFLAKLQRWTGATTHDQVVLVLDGINERQPPDFWAVHLIDLVTIFGTHASIIVTCRKETWQDEIRERIPIKPTLVSVGPFNDEEFADALRGFSPDDVERMYRLGALVRKPRYFAIAKQMLANLDGVGALTVERLFYEALKEHSRVDYPLASRTFEGVLRELARLESDRLTHRTISDRALPPDPDGAIFRELATGGVLRRTNFGGFEVSAEHLIPGAALLLLDSLRRSCGDVQQSREEARRWLSDPNQVPLTARIYAAAATRALLDPELPGTVASALVLEFVRCTNVEPDSLEGVLTYLAVRVDALCDVCEQLWAEPQVDHQVERLLLRGLVAAANDPTRRDGLKGRLARWAGFVHADSDWERPEDSPAAMKVRERVLQLAPEVGNTAVVSPDVVLTRVGTQRSVRLGRLALAVVSFTDRARFFDVLLNCLVGDAVMLSSRSGVSSWALSSSRTPLEMVALPAVSRLTGLTSEERERVERIVLDAITATHRDGDAPTRTKRRDELTERAWRTPALEELAEYLVDRDLPGHLRLAHARSFAPDPRAEFPASFISEFQSAVAAFDPSARHQGRMTNDADMNWENFEPVLCRVDPDLLQERLRMFVRDISQRSGEPLYAWAFGAEELNPILAAPEVTAIRAAWDALCAKPEELEHEERYLEATLFASLLAHAPSVGDQLRLLTQRHRDGQPVTRACRHFREFQSDQQQVDAASMVGIDGRTDASVLWFASDQRTLNESIWYEPVRNALCSADALERGLALSIATRHFSPVLQQQLIGDVDLHRQGVGDLERSVGTRMLLERADMPGATVLNRCDLSTCCYMLGRTDVRNKDEVLRAFSGALLVWLRLHVAGNLPPGPAVPFHVDDPRNSSNGLPTWSEDWSKIDGGSVSLRNEYSSWGGMPPASMESFTRAFSPSDESRRGVREEFLAAINAAAMRGDWAYLAFWSDETLRALIDRDTDFLPTVRVVLEEGLTKRRLHRLRPFIGALCRSLFRDQPVEAFRLLEMVEANEGFGDHLDGWSGESLFDEAVFAAPNVLAMDAYWRARVDAAKSDAELFRLADLLMKGGNKPWLDGLIAENLGSEAPFQRRRGVILSGVTANDDVAFDAGVKALFDHFRGMEDVIRVARKHCDVGRWMRHWIQEGLRATSGIDAYRAAKLLLQCADRRVWKMLLVEAVDGGDARSHFLDILTRNELSNAVKNNKEDGRKTLLGQPVYEDDAAPWIDL